jgi:hypothetical protein
MCSGKYCDSVGLICCPYIDGVDRTALLQPASGYFSEEQPNGVSRQNQLVKSIQCRGEYCDDINLSFFTTNYFQSTGVCTWITQVSEEQGEGQCANDEFVCGMKCIGDYCDAISLYCCKAR